MYKHGFPALFTCGMKRLFLPFIFFEAFPTTLTSSITSWLVTNWHVHGVLPKLLQPLLSNLPSHSTETGQSTKSVSWL